MNQIITFATAFKTRHSAIIDFVGTGLSPPPPSIQVGEIALRSFRWTAQEAVEPGTAALTLSQQVAEWLQSFVVAEQTGG